MYEPGMKVPLLVRGPGIKAGGVAGQFVANIDLATTFLDLAGLPVPPFMQGRSLAPLLHGESPKDWRTSVYYRYYHSPGHHNTAIYPGVRCHHRDPSMILSKGRERDGLLLSGDYVGGFIDTFDDTLCTAAQRIVPGA